MVQSKYCQLYHTLYKLLDNDNRIVIDRTNFPWLVKNDTLYLYRDFCVVINVLETIGEYIIIEYTRPDGIHAMCISLSCKQVYQRYDLRY